MGVALWSWFLVGSEGNVRQWTLLARRRFRPSVPWSVLQCHGVLVFRNRSLGGHCGTILRACELHFGAGFLSVQKATLGSGPCLLGAASVLQCHGVLLFRNRPLGGRCGAVLRAWELHFRADFLSVQKPTLGTGACLLGADRQTDRAAWELHFGAGFLSAQKATLGSGACLLGAASVLLCHGVLLFRNRPLGGRCGAVLKAWELHFGAGFLSVQKATLGSGACLLGAASVLQCHGILLFRNRPLGGHCGAVLRAWELHFGAGFLSVQKAMLGTGASLLGAERQTDRQADRQTGMPWCVAVSEPPAETSLWSCFEGMGAALWSWFLAGSEGNVRQWSLLARCRFRPSVPWCVAASEPPAGRSLWSCFEGMGAALWSWFLIGSEGNVRQWSLFVRCRFRPSVSWCFAVSEPPAGTSLWSCFEGMGAALWSWFLVGSEGNVRQWSLLARRRFRPSVPWCFAVSEPPAGGSLWSCFEGMGAVLWSWFLVGSEGNVRQWCLLARRRFRPSVPWCFAVSEPPAGRSLRSCFEGMGAALWRWFLVGLEGNVRQ